MTTLSDLTLAQLTTAYGVLAGIPVHLRLHAEDCTFAFGVAKNGARCVRLEQCERGTLDAKAEIPDIENALLALARKAAAGHGAENKKGQRPRCRYSTFRW